MALERNLQHLHLESASESEEYEYGSDEEKDYVDTLCLSATHLGATQHSYSEGVLYVSFDSKLAAQDYAALLDASDVVDDYEIEAVSDTEIEGEELTFDAIPESGVTHFDVFVYLNPDIVSYASEEIDEEVKDENGKIFEIKRVLKVNFRGKRRIKMQCRPGFKWNAAQRTCTKIGGAELVTKRRSVRQAVRTKKSKGKSFRVQIARKTKRAMRFRKAMGRN